MRRPLPFVWSPLLPIVLIAGAATLVAGFDTTKAPHVGRDDPLEAEDYPEVSVAKDARKVLRFDEPRVEPSDGERPMSVQVGVRNVYKKPVHVQYRFEFYDAGSRPLTRDEVWQYEPLPSRTQKTWVANALDQRAETFRLIVRLAQ